MSRQVENFQRKESNRDVASVVGDSDYHEELDHTHRNDNSHPKHSS